MRGLAAFARRHEQQGMTAENRRAVLSYDHSTLTKGRAMLLVVTGASGVGKSTVRDLVLAELDLASIEIRTLRPDLFVRGAAERQEVGEQIVALGAHLARTGRHLLFCDDPFPTGEVLACPSADLVEVAMCQLDVAAGEQKRRLRARGEPEANLVHHVAFADWMRQHASDPRVRPGVIVDRGWPYMVWERWVGREDIDPLWNTHMIDTTTLSPPEVAAEVTAWARRALAGEAPTFPPGWHLPPTEDSS